MVIEIQKAKQLTIVELKPLIEDSKSQGFLFVQRLIDNWLDRQNCLNQKGEVLYNL